MSDHSRRVLAIEAWDGGSHRAVRRSIERHGTFDWTWIRLAPGPWRWRQRLGMLEAIAAMTREGVLEEQWDCIVCTSLLPVGEVRGLLPEALRGVPLVLLMHENQVAYPDGVSGPDSRDLHAPVTDLTSLVAADKIIWTSSWNQRSCLHGLAELLRHAPFKQAGDCLDAVAMKSEVVWPPVEDPLSARGIEHKPNNTGRSGTGRQLVVWPHRHQQDKGPDVLADLAEAHTAPWSLSWALLGERRGPTPAGIERFRQGQQGHVEVDDFLERDAYLGWLSRCDWVLSTAEHEFFGIAVVEALLAGCLPWLPPRLSYPELVPEEAGQLNPGMTLSEADRSALRLAMHAHLAPAVAPEAVRRLEQAIATVWSIDWLAVGGGDG